nr:hypothetical protein [Tanacetum cinerariifolium]
MFEDFRSELVEGKEKRAREELIQESTKKQKVEDDKETAELKQLMEIIPDKEEVEIDAIPLAVKSPMIVECKIYKEGKKSYYQIMKADGKTQMYMVYMLVEKIYLLTPPTLTMMLEKKLQIDYQRRIVRIKSLRDAVGITVAHVCVNAAQLELVAAQEL